MTTHWILTATALLLVVGSRHYVTAERADHLLLLETLPDGFHINRPTFLDVRTNFSGTVRVVESSEFRVVVNISAADLQAAYKVQAKLHAWNNGLLLQVSEKDTSAGMMNLTWLAIALGWATLVTLVLTSLYAWYWYRSERSLYDLAERKSVAGSSVRGVYRSRNSLQVVNLPPLGDLPIPPPPPPPPPSAPHGEDADGLHNDDSLKQVPEMPEEEEAEAIEMEELTLLKLKDLDHNDPTTNESDGHKMLTTQERNLIKNQFHAAHSSGKNVHKDMLKKDKPPKVPPKRRTANGLYTGVASGPESGSADESFDSENDTDLDITGDSIRELSSTASEPNYENAQQQGRKPAVTSFMSPQRHPARQGIGLVTTSTPVSNLEVASKKGYAANKPDNLLRSPAHQDYHTDPSSSSSPGLLQQVMADVHKAGGSGGAGSGTTPPPSQQQAEFVKVATPEKQSHPGGSGGMFPPEAPRPTLTTFSSPAQQPAGPSIGVKLSRAIRFKEPDDTSGGSSSSVSSADARQDFDSRPPPPPVLPKYNPVDRYAPVQFPAIMGDIPEDPREDCESVRSGSVRSRSLYGSSEIFDANNSNPEHTSYYYNLADSDIEIPPLDADDVLSDGGIPSPLTSSLGRSPMTRDDSNVMMGQRFFGRGSPSTSLGGSSTAPRPRPYSSIIVRGMDHSNQRPTSDSGMSSPGMSSETSTPVSSGVDSSSSVFLQQQQQPLPPPPEVMEDISQDGGNFSFPPPPTSSELQGPQQWNSGRPESSGGEYVTLPNNSSIKGTVYDTGSYKRPGAGGSGGRGGRRGGGGGGGRPGFGTTFTNLTLLSVMSILALMTGGVCSKKMASYSDTDDETKVDITVFAPASFLSAKHGTVYFNLEKDTALDIEGNFDFEAYVPSNPVLRESRPELCYNNECEHGCDVQTGQCMCHKGYRPINDKLCIDVNECAEGFTNCHPSAGCLNRKGSYDCVCSVDYYGDGKTCHDCSTPCRDDQYEVQACSKTSQKICQECTKVCHNGYYMATQCTPINNAVCRVCQPKCLPGQYEYRTCSNYHDRQCKDVNLLPEVMTSDNIILEEDRKVKESEVIIEHLRSLSVGNSPYTVKRDCNTPCRENEYEVQPCSRMMQRTCRECTKTCPKGQYMAVPCQSPVADAVCRVCRAPCPDGQYEFKPCSNKHDRGCRDKKLHPDGLVPDSSKSKGDKDSDDSREHLRTPSIRYMRYSLKRGTGLHVDIRIQDMEAAQQFKPLDIPDLNISTSSPASLQSKSVQRFCPHPVPDHYILHYTKHPDITYLLDDKGNIKPCHTYKNHGKFPDEASRKDNSFLCREPGSLTKLFEIPPETFQTTTVWAEKSKRCANHSTKCEQCTRKCAQSMTSDPDCKIIGDNNDNGWSPRLRVCYNCCARNNCASDCQDYHRRRRCQPLKCQRGNLVDFTIFPVWNSNQDGKFFCHIQPVAKQRLLEMTYTVRSDARKDPVHTATIRVDGGEEWEKYGHTVHKDKLLDIIIDSHLGQMPNFLEGKISSDNNDFLVGNYIKDGSRVETTVVGGESLRIHPLKPSGVHFTKTDPQKCENDILKESLIASEHQTPYRTNHNLMAVAFHNNSSPFIVTHARQPPTIRITADKRSFLKRIFPHATLRPGVLTGRMTQNASHWVVEMMGSVMECPGYLRIVLSDPAYPSTPLFSCDVAVTCPPNFHMHFYLPTADSPGQDRQVVVSVADVKQVHHLRLHRPSKDDVIGEAEGPPPTSTVAMQTPAPLQQKEVSPVTLPQGFIFSIPFMVSVGGAVFLLLCLLIIGLIVQPGVPAPEPPILRCHHAFFMVIYIVFQFIYSIVATSSVFFLVVIAVNSPRVTFIQQHQQQAAATTASHHLELTAMQTFLEREIRRQDNHMDSVRSVCRKDMDVIIADMKEVHNKVMRETEDVFHKHKLVMLLEEHRHHSMQQLSQDLLSFRNKYNQAVQTMLLELNHNIQQAQQSIENSTWLAGARHLHAIVTSTRKHIEFVDTKPFMDWAHLESDLSKLTVDVSFSLPSLPRLADIEKAMELEADQNDPQPTKRSKDDRQAGNTVRTTHIYNQWFSPFPHNASYSDFATLGGSGSRANGLGRNWEKRNDSFVVFYIILALLASLDLILVLHRMLKAKIVGQLLLYGFPEYMDFRERKDDGDDDVFSDNTKCRCWSDSLFCQAVKAFMTQLISSTFLPKAVVVVAVALMIRGVLHISSTTLTVQSLHKAGLYHSSEEYLELHSQLINGRLKAHAHHINTIDFPAFQTWMSTVVQRHQFAFQVYQQQLQRMQRVHTQSYCQYLQTLDLTGNCSHHSQGGGSQDKDITYGIISPGCQFQPVLPRFYKRSESEYRNLSEQQLAVVLENLRAMIFDTCQIIIVFLSIIVLKELICAVVWIFIRRSGLIRLRIIYETDQDEPGPTG